MAPRQGGLGPLGRAAVQRAGEEDRRAPVSNLANPGPVSPASTSTVDPDEDVGPPDNWHVFPSSSRCVEAAYDSQRQRLFVRFVKPAASGTPWVYNGVPPNVWKNFRRNSSPGSFVNTTLNRYNNHRGDF